MPFQARSNELDNISITDMVLPANLIEPAPYQTLHLYTLGVDNSVGNSIEEQTIEKTGFQSLYQ